MGKRNEKKVLKTLLASKARILTHLKQVIKDRDFSYRTFGTDIEDYLIDEVIKILKEKHVIKSETDFHKSHNKNEFPDLKILQPQFLALEVKSGNHSRKKGSKWVGCKNSNNDMGTLNSWQSKIKKFGGENIYYIFIEYDFNLTKKIIDVKVAPFFEFLALNKDGMLRYREKDGNLRPKDFNKQSTVKSFTQFQKLFSKTEVYRSSRIIKKHLNKLPRKVAKKILREMLASF